jgi:hypothetical protein
MATTLGSCRSEYHPGLCRLGGHGGAPWLAMVQTRYLGLGQRGVWVWVWCGRGREHGLGCGFVHVCVCMCVCGVCVVITPWHRNAAPSAWDVTCCLVCARGAGRCRTMFRGTPPRRPFMPVAVPSAAHRLMPSHPASAPQALSLSAGINTTNPPWSQYAAGPRAKG